MTEDRFAEQVANLPFIEGLYQEYLADQKAVDRSWLSFFKQKDPSSTQQNQTDQKLLTKELFRLYGHLAADFNPLGTPSLAKSFEEYIRHYGIEETKESEWKRFYAGKIGFEFKGCHREVQEWIQNKIETDFFETPLSAKDKKEMLMLLAKAGALESFLHTKHVGKKRFSIEGAETLIPMLAFLISQAESEGTGEIVIGMSHRGRLNVLANIMGKPLEVIFKEFDEEFLPPDEERMGDVRYHKGYSNKGAETIGGKKIRLLLNSNPSHLESVCPVVEGQTKAKQVLGDFQEEFLKVIPVIIHGDAAIAGQGIVYETIQMSRLKGYETGGTIHFVVNNQVGFTTSPEEGRSTLYCTDIAHAFGAPVFHVSGEDPENALKVTLLALEIRSRFHIDVFIDLNCYRKYGHNEGDEPFFTQPVEYGKIKKKESVLELYGSALIQEGVLSQEAFTLMKEKARQVLQEAYTKAYEGASQAGQEKGEQIPSKEWGKGMLKELAKAIYKKPSDFHINQKVEHLFQERLQNILNGRPLDWGTVESLAYAWILWQGYPVRISGQDSARGTFSHRHARLTDQTDGKSYYPLCHLKETQGRFDVLNSPLSEAAVLGFEYGYSLVQKKGLVIWEAQFGDFANSAQVIIDQYIASGEEKWGEESGIVLLLPHGYEGQGPEHSSARLERYLSLSGDENWVVANVTTPAQFFFILTSHALLEKRKPLVLMTPKGLLRHPDCTSTLSEIEEGKFLRVIGDFKAKDAEKVVFCSGKVYYDLAKERQRLGKEEAVALIRLEQLYPLDEALLREVTSYHKKAERYLWVQEEPKNMGAWPYIGLILPSFLLPRFKLEYVGRSQSATPATGFHARHKKELLTILKKVFEE